MNNIVTLKSGLEKSLKVIESGAIQKLGCGFLYSPSIVTMVVSVAVCEIFSVKEWCELENRVRVHSRSLEMAPFDRSHTSSYSPSIVTMAISAISCIVCENSDLLAKIREIFYTPPVFAPRRG